MKKINDLNVLITGGTKGIGFETAKELSGKVNNIVVCGRSFNKELNQFKNVYFIECDLSNSNNSFKLKEELDKMKINIEVLINNAGTAFFKPLLETNINEIKSLFELNFFSVIELIKIFSPNMIENKFGKIININSVASKKIFQNNSIYGASKYALDCLTKTYRQEIRDKGIDIIDVYPGATETQLWDHSTKNEREGRMMEAYDVANAIKEILFLSMNSRMIPEEIVLRPKLGDL